MECACGRIRFVRRHLAPGPIESHVRVIFSLPHDAVPVCKKYLKARIANFVITAKIEQRPIVRTSAFAMFRLAFQFFRTSVASALGYIMLFAVIVLTSLYLYAIQTRRAEPVNE